MKRRRSIPVLALAFSLTLHAAAFAALLADWRTAIVEPPALSVELVIVSAPLESTSTEAPAAAQTPPPAETETKPAPAPPEQARPAPVPAPELPPEPPPEQPKPVKKVETAKPPAPAPQPQPKPAPPRFDAPINLNPGPLPGEQTQQARAPSGLEGPSAFAVLYGPIPPYPPLARERGQEGKVTLDVTIGLDGIPSRVTVARSSGAALLDEQAVTTVQTWRFRNDSGRTLTLAVPIVFELRASAGR